MICLITGLWDYSDCEILSGYPLNKQIMVQKKDSWIDFNPVNP